MFKTFITAESKTSASPGNTTGNPLPFFQAKLTVNNPGDEYEQEADAIADQVMRKHDGDPPIQRMMQAPLNSVRRECSECPKKEDEEQMEVRRKQTSSVDLSGKTAPSIVSEVLSSGGGQSMEGNTRQFMESRFGQDFSAVRIHTDSKAAESAGAIQAHAYTSGRNVVFGTGAYQPGSEQGKRLLAHELAHVAQQANGLEGVLQRKPKPAPFYQEAVDEVKKEEKSLPRLSSGTPIDILRHLPEVRKILDLARAIDESRSADIPSLTTAVLGIDRIKLSPIFPSRTLMSQMAVRLLQMGMEEQSRQLIAWSIVVQVESWGSSTEGRKRDLEYYFWDQIVEDLEAQVSSASLADSKKSIEGGFVLFKLISQRLDKFSLQELEDQRKSRALRASMLEPTGFGMSLHDDSLLAQFESITRLLPRVFTVIQIAFQGIMDAAIQDLENGAGRATLDLAKDLLEKRLAPLIDPEIGKHTLDAVSKRRTGMVVDVTKSDFSKKKSKHLDFFNKNPRTGPNVVVNLYDVTEDMSFTSEMKMSFGQIYEIRSSQIVALEKIYGLEVQKTGKLTPEAKTNAFAIQQLQQEKGHLKLHSNEDWRKFALAKFEKHLADGMDKAKAFDAVIRLLELYLNAFTVHTPHNIDDFGDDLLKKTFPRALSGQLIHDCGVYALRIAFVLSLIREHPDLKLRFRFVLLPVHIGLIITGSGLATYIIHNDVVRKYEPQEIDKIKKDWQKTDEKGDERVTPVPLDENQFLGELAANEFIPRTSLPFKILEVPHLPAKEKTAREQLWKFYRNKVASDKIFGGDTQNAKSPFYQFHLKYLGLLNLNKRFYNENLLPMWNVDLPIIFEKHEKRLTDTWTAFRKASKGAQKSRLEAEYFVVLSNYETEIFEIFDKLNNSRTTFSNMGIDIPKAENDVGEEAGNFKKKIVSKGTSLAYHFRLNAILDSGFWWDEIKMEHLIQMHDPKSTDSPKTIFNKFFKPLQSLM